MLAGGIGNVLEWYDFSLYASFAILIGRLYFPLGDPTASLLAALAVFASGFLVRPIGGILFGQVADRLGRRRALTLSIALMAVPTFLIGLLPTYAGIGVLAPLLLLVLRLFHGLASGGEYAGAISYLVEHAPPARRGLVGSTAPLGAFTGILLGSAVSAGLTSALPAEALEAWGWRLPFLLGLLVGAVGLWLRLRAEETPHFAGLVRRGTVAPLPLFEAVRCHRRALLLTAGVTVLPSLACWLVFTSMPTYLVTVVGMPAALALGLNTVGLAGLVVATPFAGALSDRIGRKPVLLAGVAGAVLLTLPLFALMAEPAGRTAGLAGVLAALGVFALLSGLFAGAMPAALAEQFPTRVRVSALALGYNTVESLVGGTAPLLGAWLVAATGNPLAPALDLVAVALVTALVVLRFRETHTASLA